MARPKSPTSIIKDKIIAKLNAEIEMLKEQLQKKPSEDLLSLVSEADLPLKAIGILQRERDKLEYVEIKFNLETKQAAVTSDAKTLGLNKPQGLLKIKEMLAYETIINKTEGVK